MLVADSASSYHRSVAASGIPEPVTCFSRPKDRLGYRIQPRFRGEGGRCKSRIDRKFTGRHRSPVTARPVLSRLSKPRLAQMALPLHHHSGISIDQRANRKFAAWPVLSRLFATRSATVVSNLPPLSVG